MDMLRETLRDAHASRSSRAHCDDAVVCSAEAHGYDNTYLLSSSKKHKIMNKELETGLGKRVYGNMRNGSIYNAYCSDLLDALVASASEGCGIGRLTYAALVRAWRRDTHDCSYDCNESLARTLLASDQADPRVLRLGTEGHYAYYVAPRTDEAMMQSDSLRVLVSGWLRSWQRWYDAVVRWGHYADDPAALHTCVSGDLLRRCSALWSYRGVGGRRAMTTTERAQRAVSQSVSALSPEQLRAALTAAGVDIRTLLEQQ